MIDLAKYIGISQAAVSKFENGKIDFKERNLEKYKEFIDSYERKGEKGERF